MPITKTHSSISEYSSYVKGFRGKRYKICAKCVISSCGTTVWFVKSVHEHVNNKKWVFVEEGCLILDLMKGKIFVPASLRISRVLNK